MAARFTTFLLGAVVVTVLTACSAVPLDTASIPATAPSAQAPLLTLSPTQSPTSSVTLTPTPIPPQRLILHWPQEVSALEPVWVEVEVIPPPGIPISTTVRALIRQPDGTTYWQALLSPRSGYRYRADEPVRLPLEPLKGQWRLVVSVSSNHPVEGPRVRFFEPAPIAFYDLANDPTFRHAVHLQVPLTFRQIRAEGNAWAGIRIWQTEEGEVGLWWAPGPTEPLQLHTAIAMLEATYESALTPQVLDAVELEWQGQRAFLFREQWPVANGGPGEALVTRGPDLWLYVVRVRALGRDVIPELLQMVRDTFSFVESAR